jgi:hypothetical protein
MSRQPDITPRRTPRSRAALGPLKAWRVPASLYPPDPCVAIPTAVVAAPGVDFPPQPIIPRASAEAVRAIADYPPQPI